MKQPAVYILASKRNGTLYTGVTSNLIQRVWQHKQKQIKGFTQKYDVGMLVWFEIHETMETAINREKRIKEWQRKWKLELIEKTNPDWRDLYDEICGLGPDFRRDDGKGWDDGNGGGGGGKFCRDDGLLVDQNNK